MKKLLSLLLVLCLSFTLFACKNDGDDAPEGMKAVGGDGALGFTFYVPEAWIDSSYGSIASAYLSSLDTSSVSLVRVDLGGVAFEEYVKGSLSASKNEVTYLEEGKAVNVGNAKRALSYVYSYLYGEYTYQFMQVLCEAEDGACYLFTYGASAQDKTEGKSFYASHLDEVAQMLASVKFGKALGETTEEVVYGRDADGYKLVSDEKTCGFAFYIPESFKAELSLGIVLAVAEDNATVTVAEATSTGMAVRAYYENRLAELRLLYEDVTEVTALTECTIGNSSEACYAEYSYRDGENTYRVYQVIAVGGGSIFGQKGYVLTYTAPDTVYENHLDELAKMMEKIRF